MISSWNAPLRIARRDAWKAKGRSALVVALIGLPILAIGVGDIAWRTYQLSPSETISRELGHADAEIRWEGGAVTQSPKAWIDTDGNGITTANTANTANTSVPSTRDALALLAAGTTTVPVAEYSVSLNVKTKLGIEYSQQTGLDYANPISNGLVRQVSGRSPQNDHEIAITKALSSKTALHLGDTLQTVSPSSQFNVVGIVVDAAHNKAASAYTLPSAIPTNQANSPAWLLSAPNPITWTEVLKLNKAGYSVLSRSVYLNPPPKSEIPGDQNRHDGADTGTATVLSLIVGLALFEVVLLAGPAFAVGARRQTRNLALIAAAGGRRKDLRNVVLSSGLVLGLVSGVAGVVFAVAIAAGGIRVFGDSIDAVAGSFDLRPVELAALVVLAMVTALASSMLPARAASRTNVLDALNGRRAAIRSSKRLLVAGLAVAAIGVFISLGGFTSSGRSTGAKAILGGLALIELGMIICTPAILGATSAIGKLLPLSPRIALRDAARNRSAASPAVAAVMATVIGAVAISIGVASANDRSQRDYTPSLPTHNAYAIFDTSHQPNAAAVMSALQSAFPGTKTTLVSTPTSDCTDSSGECTVKQLNFDPTVAAGLGGSSSVGFYTSQLPSVLVDDGSHVEQLLGAANLAASAALQSGRAVVFNSMYSKNGTTQLTYGITKSGGPGDGSISQVENTLPTVSVPSTVVDSKFVPAAIIVPPSYIASIGTRAEPSGVLVSASHSPSDKQLQVARGEISSLGVASQLYVENGYQNRNGWAATAVIAIATVIAVGAAIIATALANVDGRPDLITLGSVGASPRTRRLLSISRSAVISVIGTALGTAGGMLAALAWLRSAQSNLQLNSGTIDALTGQPFTYTHEHYVIPWTALVATVAGIPLVAALFAGLFTRSRLPSERRVAE